jgi:hypothetical protein
MAEPTKQQPALMMKPDHKGYLHHHPDKENIPPSAHDQLSCCPAGAAPFFLGGGSGKQALCEPAAAAKRRPLQDITALMAQVCVGVAMLLVATGGLPACLNAARALELLWVTTTAPLLSPTPPHRTSHAAPQAASAQQSRQQAPTGASLQVRARGRCNGHSRALRRRITTAPLLCKWPPPDGSDAAAAAAAVAATATTEEPVGSWRWCCGRQAGRPTNSRCVSANARPDGG